MDKIFKDLIVIELASILAGPAVGMFFAELGAKVYKIENSRTQGDLTRRWKLPKEDLDYKASAYYSSINWGKNVMMKDLGDIEDREQVYDLIKKADILISNFKDSSAKKLGIDYDSLKAINSSIIFGHIKGYPNDERAAFDAVLQAESGYLSMTGEVDSAQPVKMPVALIDQLAAHQLKQGILIALLQKERTGKGSYVEASLYDSAIASLANQASNWLNESYIPNRMGTLHPNIAPYGEVFQSKEGISFLLAIGVDAHFKILMKMLDLEKIGNSLQYNTNRSRLINRQELYLMLDRAIRNMNFDTINRTFTANGIPFGRINNMKEVFENSDAQKMVINQNHEGKIMKSVKSIAFKIKKQDE